MTTVRHQALPALAALALLTACPHRPSLGDLSADPAALKEQVARAQDTIRSVSGEARVRVSLPQGAGTVQQYIAAQKPDRLHVEALDFFGNPMAVLVADAGRFALFDAQTRTYYRGPATPENLARLVPLPLRADELVTILCGGAPLLDAPATSVAPGRSRVVLELEGDGRRQVLEVGEGARAERARVTGGDPAYALRFESFREEAGGARFPLAARLEAPARKVELEIGWRSPEVNVDLDAGLFRLDPPRGAKVIDLDEAPPAESPPNLFAPPPSPPPGT